ncbi:MAG: YebC/PmpR family DNA-binding transcriptional regulator [Microgenomates group bacterium]
MSGHSHYATIKRQKETKDAARGQLFSKLARAVSVAVKTGGGANPDTNYKLRVAIDKAKVANMPKGNIDKAISKGSGRGTLEEVIYEGFGPGGIAVIVEVATDNRNRSGQEIKNLFERGGGRLAGPGAVSFNFEAKGLLLVEKKKDKDEQMLTLIDLGVEDMEEMEDGIEVYVESGRLSEIKSKLEKEGFKVTSSELAQKPKNYQIISDKNAASKILSFLNKLEEHDDVQKVFANFDIPEDILTKIDNE